jgi:hypothetical protein
MSADSETTHTHQQPEPALEQPRMIPGKYVVVAMFVFAIAMTSTLWVYSYLHAAPFQPLARAIAAEFKDSAPRVDGGRRKMHKDTPSILRMVIRVEFDPNSDDARVASMANRLTALAWEYTDLRDYDELEIHLYSLEPERGIHERAVIQTVSELMKPRSSKDEG